MKFNKLGGYGVVGPDRCCGKSLAIALGCISDALGNPGLEVPIVDHHPTRAADMHLFHTVVSLIDQINLKHITMNRARMTIQFNLYEDRECPETILQHGRFWKRVDYKPPTVYIEGAEYRPI